MNFLKSNRTKIISAVILISLLVFTYFYGGNNPSEAQTKKEEYITSEFVVNEAPETEIVIEEVVTPQEEPEVAKSIVLQEEVQPTESETAPVVQENATTEETVQPEKTPVMKQEDVFVEKSKPEKEVEKQTAPASEKGKTIAGETQVSQYSTFKDHEVVENDIKLSSDEPKTKYCTISIRCDTILNNMDFLEKDKHQLVPSDGVILKESKVSFNEGESVFDVLLRETRNNKIHMEYMKSPVYDSAYIEGIHNLYEFDCGELSGWMYRVNGVFPNYGCSKYVLNDGDCIEWLYTCELGKDLQSN